MKPEMDTQNSSPNSLEDIISRLEDVLNDLKDFAGQEDQEPGEGKEPLSVIIGVGKKKGGE